MKAFEAVIGLEIHAQLLTRSKLFCVSPNSHEERPNQNIGWTSVGLPGSLPVLNLRAVQLAVRAGIALNSKIRKKSCFSRKNYFYPDLPKGYQISQFDLPLCEGGIVAIGGTSTFPKKEIHLDHIHLEEDAGKLVHNMGSTLVNLNRAGIPLIEIVSKPELRTPQEAAEYMRTVHSILVDTEVCDGNLELGNFRCDANVSVRPLGSLDFGTRAEIKNINSFKFLEKAIEYEIARQIAVVESGGQVVQETRGWDATGSKTFSMRLKEDADDYRYFPDPDLPPLVLNSDFIENQRQSMPELSAVKSHRYIHQQGLSPSEAEVLVQNKSWSAFYESVIKLGVPFKLASSWILTELVAVMKEMGWKEIHSQPVSPSVLSQLLSNVDQGKLTARSAKKVLRIFANEVGKRDMDKIVHDEGLLQISDPVQIRQICLDIANAFPDEFSEFLKGNMKAMQFVMGECMKATKGRLNPTLTESILSEIKNEKSKK